MRNLFQKEKIRVNIKGADEKGNGCFCEIKITGHLEEHWSDWLGGLEFSQDGRGSSILTGIVPDRAALDGVLAQIRDLELTLISITPKDIDGETSEGDGENVERSSE